MSTAIANTFEGHDIRHLIVDGEPIWIGKDVCDVVGISKYRDALAQLDPDERVSVVVDTLGGAQQMTGVTEAGIWSLMLISRSPVVKDFKRWLTHTVLPQIRKTGGYVQRELSRLELIDLARDSELGRIAAEERNVELSGAVAELTPKARTFDLFLGASGDYSVGEAAKILCRDSGIEIGERRLFAWMDQHSWVYRVKGKPIPYQAQVDAGRLVAKARWYTDDAGEQVAATPQVRVTAKGLDVLRSKLIDGAA